MSSVEIRAFLFSDLDQLLAWRNKPENRRFFREYRPLTGQQHRRWYDSLADQADTQMFAIEHEGNLVGACGLCHIDWLSRSAEISIYIGEGYIDEEIAPKALIELMHYAVDVMGLRRLWAETWNFDDSKRLLLSRQGFSPVVRKRQAHWYNGWQDALVYERLFIQAKDMKDEQTVSLAGSGDCSQVGSIPGTEA